MRHRAAIAHVSNHTRDGKTACRTVLRDLGVVFHTVVTVGPLNGLRTALSGL